MKKLLFYLVATAFMLTSCQQKQPVETTNPNNLFSTLLGKSDSEVQARIDSIWTHFFTPGDINRYDADGEKSVYYEVGDSMGIIVDTGSNDVRTEGMSAGNVLLTGHRLDKATLPTERFTLSQRSSLQPRNGANRSMLPTRTRYFTR